MSILLVVLLVMLDLGLMALIIVAWVAWKVFRRPLHHPGQYLLERSKRPRPEVLVCCAGDSLTHATISASYVDILRQRLEPDGYFFINAGVNSELAYNVFQRLEQLVVCQPDVVTLLIGTNDVNATMSEGNLRRYMRSNQLPQEPTLAWYRENVVRIVRTLKEKTSARIALISPPVLGEGLGEESNRRVARYAAELSQLAREQHVAYLPLFELMVEELEETRHVPRRSFEAGVMGMARDWLKQYLLKQSYDRISEDNGYYFLTDGIHLNTRAARLVARLIEDFLQQGTKR
ncbi:MAG: SGNH/GDSL hydrolase family protein [Myxococcota bacterium]